MTETEIFEAIEALEPGQMYMLVRMAAEVAKKNRGIAFVMAWDEVFSNQRRPEVQKAANDLMDKILHPPKNLQFKEDIPANATITPTKSK